MKFQKCAEHTGLIRPRVQAQNCRMKRPSICRKGLKIRVSPGCCRLKPGHGLRAAAVGDPVSKAIGEVFRAVSFCVISQRSTRSFCPKHPFMLRWEA